MDPIIKYCTVGRQLGYAGYLSLDAATFLDVAGIRKSPSTKRLQKEAARFWMTGILFSTISGVYSLYNLRQQEGRIDKKEGEGVVASKRIEKYVIFLACDAQGYENLLTSDSERAAINKQLLQDLCDLVVPATTLGFTNFDDGFVGLAGTVSSLIGVHSQWKKTA